MRIKTYDQNNVLISDNEIKCDVPKYVREFNNNRPLVRINSMEHKLLNSKSESIDKLFLIEKFRQILQYDYSLYLHSEHAHSLKCRLRDNAFGYGIQEELEPPLEIKEILRDKNEWLENLLNRVDEYAQERWRNPGNMCMWLAYIKSESKDSWTSFLNNIPYEDYWKYSDHDLEESNDELEQVSWRCAKRYRLLLDTLRNEVYPQLKRKSMQSIRLKSILNLIPTSYSSQLKPYSFNDDKFVIKLCNTLYETNCKRRSEVYGILLTYNFMTQMITTPTVSLMLVESEDYVFTIDSYGNSKIEIVSSSQENAFIKISDHPKKNIRCYKESLDVMYDSYVKTKAKEIEKYTEGEFLTHDIKINHWKELHSALRKDISLKKDLIGRNRPESYYYLMILKYDDNKNNIIINDEFIKDLLIVNDKFHSVALTDIFDYIYQFNYIKSRAYPIKSKLFDNNIVFTDDPFVWENNYERKYTLEESIERALAFIEPILNSNFIEKVKGTDSLCVEPDCFREIFRKLFREVSDESVRSNLELFKEPYKEDGYPYQGFNYKLLLNIIGMLKTFHYKKTDRDVIRIFKKKSKNLADKLMDNRSAIKVKHGWSAFRKYISDYRKYTDSYDSKKSFSIVKAETIKFIQERYNIEPDINFEF